jgi:nucleotide-binding universal stress UspA family protein
LTRNVVALATIDHDFGHVPADTAKEEAKTIANEEGKPVTLRDPVTDEVLGKVKPTAKKPAKAKASAKPKAAAKAAAKKSAAKAKPAKESKPKSPRGMVVEILKLASRAKGVSPAELNELTKWKGAPWKWLFANPKRPVTATAGDTSSLS